MSVKNPNPSAVSRAVTARAKGYIVTSEHGRTITYAERQPVGSRFHVVKVVAPEADVEAVAEQLNAAGYHAEAHTLALRTFGSDDVKTYRAVIVFSQEELDHRARRLERAANAQAEAEEIAPSTPQVEIRRRRYPSHERDTAIVDRAQALEGIVEALRDTRTDVLTEEGVRITRDWSDPRDSRVSGLLVYPEDGGREEYLFLPVDEPKAPAVVEEWCTGCNTDHAPALCGYRPEELAEPAPAVVEGNLIPAGHALGADPKHADNDSVRDAVAALTAAGHTPALLSGETDDDDNDSAQGTGFRVEPRDGDRVYVYHLVKGVDSWRSLSDDERRSFLRAYRAALRAAGWECDGRLFRCVHAWRTAPLPEGVTLAQTRGEIAPADRLAPGTRVRHTGQRWATSVAAPEGTAVILGVTREHNDGTCEYEVLSGEDFSRRIGEDNPMTRKVEWNSATVRAVEEEDEEQQMARTLPTLEGHTITARAGRGRWVIEMREDGNPEPLYSDWTMRTDAVVSFAREMIRVRLAALAEAEAIEALDETTLYEVCEYRASIPLGDPITMTGSEVRIRLQTAREEAGPEKLHGRNSPRFTVEHSGANWWTTHHAYTSGGHRDQWNRLHISARPLVVAQAAQLIMRGTGDGCLSPVEKPGTQAFGPWVRPVPGRADVVIVSRVANGLHLRPADDTYGARWDEWMGAYRAALEAAGWALDGETADGWIFEQPSDQH